MFNSHRCRHCEPTQVDIDFHYSPDALALIVSVTNPRKPDLKAFRIREGAATPVPIRVV